MKKKLISVGLALVLVLSFSMVTAVPVAAADPTTIPSSTMIFGSLPPYILTYDSVTGIYEGMIPMLPVEPVPPGDGQVGYDLYAKNGATAWFGDDPDGWIGPSEPVWTPLTIVGHDPFPGDPVDTPDWYQYSLNFYEEVGVQKWRVANHSGATEALPWFAGGGSGAVEQGVPMSGTMDWTTGYAAEIDFGVYLPPVLPTNSEIPGGAAFHGGGVACWDMDWSWGSEVIPLQFPGFNVVITEMGTGMYVVALIPGVVPALELNEDWYRTLDTVYVTVEDAAANDPLRTDYITVKAISDYDVTGITVTLTETDMNTGVFKGLFPLVPAPDPPGATPDELVVEDGDLITVTYLGVTDTATVDDTHPVISSFSPADGTTVTDAKPVISATLADDASGIDIDTGVMAIDGTPIVAAVTVSDISFTPGTNLAEGVHTVIVDVSDVAGNAATQASWSFTVDTEKPTVAVALAPDPPYTAEVTITFTLNFNDPMDTGIAPEVTFGLTSPYDLHSVNGDWRVGSQVEWLGESVIVAPWTQDGEHTLSVSGAQDLAGNVMVSDTSTAFVIDLNAPFAPFYAQMHVNQNPPGTADSVYGDDYAVESNAFVEVWNDASARDPEINLIGSIDANSNGAFGLIDIGDNKNGEVWVTAMDAYGHRSDATKLLNDIVGPEIWSGTWSVGGVKPPWILEGQVIDVTITGESGCTGTFDIGAIATGVSTTETSGIYTGSYTVAAGNDVRNAFMLYRLTDAAGNFSTLGEVKGISIDTMAPTIGTLTPADGAFVDTATPKISAVLDDNLSGVDQADIVMTVDGGPVTTVYAEGVVSYTPASGLGEGSHAVTLDVSDVAGNPADQVIWSFTVDTIDPIITLDPVTTPTDVELLEIKGTFTELNLYKIVPTFNGWLQPVTISEPNWTVPTFVHLNEGDNLIVATITDLAGNSAFAEATINLDTQAPVVTLTSPNGGESLLGGNMYNVTWTASDANFITDPIAIEYSVDSGSSWNDVAIAEPNDGGYLWAVPKLDSSDCLVRVTGTDLLGHAGSDVSDTAFTITTSAPDTIAPVVRVNSPNGGEIWQGGSTQTITWTAMDDKTPSGSLLVHLYYSLNGGTDWLPIDFVEFNMGSYSWTVPEINSSQCLVKVEVSDASGNVGFDVSDRVFTITTPGEPAAPIETIDLAAGWNLASLMLIPTSSNITDVLDGINVVSVWAYDASIEDPAERWSSYVPGDVPGDLETMVDGKGYWIDMGEISGPVPLTIQGQELPDPPAALPAYSVVEGWNLIGFKSTTPRTADSYLLAIDGKYTLIRGYETIYFTVGTGEDLAPGNGYWISVVESGTIYP